MRRSPGHDWDLLERARELAALRELVDAGCRDRGSVALLEGPAGIGKTRLLEEACLAAGARGMQVLRARGSELERDFPFGVVRQLLEPMTAGVSDETRAALFSGAAEPAGRLIADSEPEGRVETGALQTNLRALYWLCVNLASEGPLLLAVDDLHWADEPSLRWTNYVAPRLDGMPILMVAAARPADPGSEHELVAALADDPRTSLLEPAPLSGPAVGELVQGTLPTAGDELCQACFDATGGNPFLLRELLATIAAGDTGLDAPATIPAVTSATVSRSVFGRLAHLPRSATALIRAVAVLGDRAELELAATLAELDPADAANVAGELTTCEILAAGRPLDFLHPIVRASVHHDIPPSERSRTHVTAARLLAAHGVPPARVAIHLLASDPTRDPWVVDTLRRAAAQATRSGAAGSAVTYLRRALIEPPDTADRSAILCELGRAEAVCGEPSAREHLAAALDSASSPADRANAALALGRAVVYSEQPEGWTDSLLRAVAGIEGEDRELALRVEAEALSFGHAGIVAQRYASARCQQLVGQVSEGRTPAERQMLAPIAWELALAMRIDADEAARLAERSLAGGALLASETSESTSFYVAAGALTVSDRLRYARRHLDAALADASDRQSAYAFGLASWWRGWAYYRAGSLSEAESDWRTALDVADECGSKLMLACAVSLLADCLLEKGENAEARRVLFQWWDRAADPVAPGAIVQALLLLARARFHAMDGLLVEALDDVRDAGRLCEDLDVRNPSYAPWRSLAARLLQGMGEADEARLMAEEEVELARTYGAPRALGIALCSAARVAGDGRRTLELLEEAVAVLAPSDARLEHARALRSLGAALIRAGDVKAARDPLRKALDGATRCGATALDESVRRALLATGARPRRAFVTGADALTPSERRIARMAADGLTNREIAERRFLTLRMVEIHLTRTYRKLGITSRRDLGGALVSGRESDDGEEHAA